MSDQDRINAIVAAIANDSNLLIVLRALISNNLANAPTAQLQNIMNLLGLS